jgi:ketosteroid isomerase-like protein
MSEAKIQNMLNGLCRAAEACDGKAFAAYFAEDGVYHDDFYGSFVGRERVAQLVTDWLHKDARDLRWDMKEPACQNDRLYTRYIFSYNSTLPEAKGARAMYEGVATMQLRDGLIADYREIISCGTAFVDMHFHPERIFKIFARKAAAFKERPEVRRHLPSAAV